MPNITIVPGTGSRRRYYPKYRIAVGPWSAGINATAEPASLESTELQQCINYVTKSDGTLVTRPPVKALGSLTTSPYLLPAWNNAQVNYAELGSVIVNSDLQPFMVATDTTDINHQKSIFYKWNSAGAGEFDPAWTTIDWLAAGPPDWVRSIIWYNNKYYIATNGTGGQSKLYSSGASTGALAAVAGAPVANYYTHMLLHKDRMFLVSADGTIYWSKATDPSVWAAPNGGSIRTGANDDDRIHAIKIFQDALYVFKNRSIWRLSWLTDPAVDGTFTKIADTGGFDCEVYNNELYFVNSRGVYKLVGQYFVDISAKISPFFRRMTQNLAFSLNKPRMGFGLYRVGTYFLVGPFAKALEYPTRYSADPNLIGAFSSTASDFYFVYSLDQQNWTTWQFAANHPTNPTGGPYGKPMPQNTLDLTEADNFIYMANVAITDPVSGVTLQRLPYYISATDLVISPATVGLGFDKGPNNAQPWEWIGGYFKTGAIDLGDGSMFKRVFSTIIEAMCIPGTWSGPNADAFKVELDSYAIPSMASPVGLIQSPAVPSTFSGWARKIVLAKGYRARIFSLIYDSMSDIHLNPHSAGDINGWPAGHINFIKKIRFTVMLGRAQTTDTTEG